MSEPARVLVCGLISADITFRVNEMPRRAEKYRAEDVRFNLGGGGAIAAVALRSLGSEVHLAGRLGDDLFGSVLRTELDNRGIDRSLVVQMKSNKSPISSIFLDSAGDRQIVNYRSVTADTLNKADSPALDARSLKERPGFEAVLVDTRWEEAAIQVLEYAREQCVPAVVDAEAPVSHAAMALATHIAFSRQGLRDFVAGAASVLQMDSTASESDCSNSAASESIEWSLQLAEECFGRWVCVTDGAEGVYYLHHGQLAHVPAFEIVAVDTLGAGDTWHAAFTLQLAQGVSEPEAIMYANAAAALKCLSSAGIDGAPSAAQVEAFLA